MCGIAGIYAYHSNAPLVEHRELCAIRDHMAARGPDGIGEWYSQDGRVGLGHRRLSIIDLSDGAAQPMASQDGQVVVSFNGEIFNYQELRDRLTAKGYRFRSCSDTEVLLNLYIDKGAEMVHELRGMFAFAIWDESKSAMLLGRDPYGIKPLYYADDGKSVRFASQVKALLAGGRIPTTEEPAGVVGFHLFGSVPEPYTLYSAIRALPAGSLLWITQSGAGQPRNYSLLSQIWVDAEKDPVKSKDFGLDVRNALLESVRYHVVSDVPVGIFLSAGIDSGALLGLMRELNPGARIQAVTINFEEFRGHADDETPLARQVARHYGAEHFVKTVTEREFRQDLPAILEAMDQPSIDGINTWFVSKAARELGLKVAISGLGGDELFGGYPSFRDIPNWVHRLRIAGRLPPLGKVIREFGELLQHLGMNFHPKSIGMFEYGGDYPGAYLLRRGLFMPWELPKILDPELVLDGLTRLVPLMHIGGFLSDGPRHDRSKVAVLESALYMRNQLLRDTDWAGMAHSLEVRVPLVDICLLRRLAPFLVNGASFPCKMQLAKAPRPVLSDSLVERTKTGFTTPVASWQYRLPSIQHDGHMEKEYPSAWARQWARTVCSKYTELQRERGERIRAS